MQGRLPVLAVARWALRPTPTSARAVRHASSQSIPGATLMPAADLPTSLRRRHGPSSACTRRGLASAAANDNEEQDGDSSSVTKAAASTSSTSSQQDAAAQRRLEALKRFGVSGGQATQGKPVARAVPPKDADGKEEPEPDWNEIWGDYIEYMDHQRTQGWKT